MKKAIVELVVAADLDGHRRIGTFAKCLVCDERIPDDQVVLSIGDLKHLESFEICRPCVEKMLASGPVKGASDKQFDAYRRKLVKRYT